MDNKVVLNIVIMALCVAGFGCIMIDKAWPARLLVSVTIGLFIYYLFVKY